MASETWDIERLHREVIDKQEWTEQEWADALTVMRAWFTRGDGAAIYENVDLGHPELGLIQILSYGSSAAQLEADPPPSRLPDIGHKINWRFWLKATIPAAGVTAESVSGVRGNR